MPFRSRQQAKFAFATHQKWAEEFAKATPSIKSLPSKVKHNKRSKVKKS